MIWTEAIIHILKENKDTPMHYVAITEAIIKENLRNNYGKTPERTVSAFLSTQPKLFKFCGQGNYCLTTEGIQYNKGKEDINDSIITQNIIEQNKSKLIKAFGMYWDRAISIDIKHPRLLGRQNSKSKKVDFVDLSEMRGIYLLHDRREVIYVGQATNSILDRLKDHTKDRHAGRWDRFSWFGIDDIDSDGNFIPTEEPLSLKIEDMINAFEGIMIEGLEPRQNRKTGNGFGEEYIQISENDR